MSKSWTLANTKFDINSVITLNLYKTSRCPEAAGAAWCRAVYSKTKVLHKKWRLLIRSIEEDNVFMYENVER